MLAERVGLDDICVLTSSSPDFADFRNLRPPTKSMTPQVETNFLWKLLSHYSLNFVSLSKIDNLKTLSKLYVLEEGRDKRASNANMHRIKRIEGVNAKNKERLVEGLLIRGMEINMKARYDNLSSPGDLFIFGSVLDIFLGLYSSINHFTKLSIENVVIDESYTRPERLGDHQII